VLLRAFLGDAERLLDESDTEVAELALDALRPILDITAHPHLARVHRWRDALPRYVVGHPARIAAIERRLAGLPGLFLAGAAYRGLGIPDCVRDGEAAAEAAVAHGDRTLTAASPGS
jgi:oxygen-dependent protoporphyrinogen oxidase